jgi:hypothetical protein
MLIALANRLAVQPAVCAARDAGGAIGAGAKSERDFELGDCAFNRRVRARIHRRVCRRFPRPIPQGKRRRRADACGDRVANPRYAPEPGYPGADGKVRK